MNNNNLLLRAAIAHFEAQKMKALATLQIYFNTAIGIGEHSGHLEEIATHTKSLAEAEECLKVLQALTQAGEQSESES